MAELATGAWAAVARGHHSSRPLAGPTTTSTAPPATVAQLGPDQTRVTGTITTMSAVATGPPLGTPLLIQVPVRGRGGGILYNVTVGGRQAQISWNGGEPLGITGGGSLVPGKAPVEVNAQGATWSLDGAERLITPGSYSIGAPVAVYTGGAFAQPEDGASFTAGANTVLVTNGGATIARSPIPLHLVGPGSLQLRGTLTLTTARGSTTASSLTLASGNFVLDVGVAGPAGLPVSGVMQGPTTTTP